MKKLWLLVLALFVAYTCVYEHVYVNAAKSKRKSKKRGPSKHISMHFFYTDHRNEAASLEIKVPKAKSALANDECINQTGHINDLPMRYSICCMFGWEVLREKEPLKTSLRFNVVGRYWQGEDIDEDNVVDDYDLQVSDEDLAELEVDVMIREGDDVGKHVLDISKLGQSVVFMHYFIQGPHTFKYSHAHAHIHTYIHTYIHIHIH